MTWPFHNYTPTVDIKTEKRRPVEIKPLPKRDIDLPKQQSRTDRITKTNSKVSPL